MSEIVAGLFQSFDGVMASPDYYHDRSLLFPPSARATSLTSATRSPPTNRFGSCVPSASSPSRRVRHTAPAQGCQ